MDNIIFKQGRDYGITDVNGDMLVPRLQEAVQGVGGVGFAGVVSPANDGQISEGEFRFLYDAKVFQAYFHGHTDTSTAAKIVKRSSSSNSS